MDIFDYSVIFHTQILLTGQTGHDEVDPAPPNYNMEEPPSNINADGSQVVPNGNIPHGPDFQDIHHDQQPNGHLPQADGPVRVTLHIPYHDSTNFVMGIPFQ